MNVEVGIYRKGGSGWFTSVSTADAIDCLKTWKSHMADDTVLELTGETPDGNLETISIRTDQIAGISTEPLKTKGK